LIFEEVQKILKIQQRSLGISTFSKVTVEWLLALLSTLNPAHEYFTVGFYPEEAKPFKMGDVSSQVLCEIPGFRGSSKAVK
jgi:hypothetical protein